jgi:hypothetical protein
VDIPHYLVLHSLEVHETDEGFQRTDQFDIAIINYISLFKIHRKVKQRDAMRRTRVLQGTV